LPGGWAPVLLVHIDEGAEHASTARWDRAPPPPARGASGGPRAGIARLSSYAIRLARGHPRHGLALALEIVGVRAGLPVVERIALRHLGGLCRTAPRTPG
jgi:hypothetical protein